MITKKKQGYFIISKFKINKQFLGFQSRNWLIRGFDSLAFFIEIILKKIQFSKIKKILLN